MSFFLTSNSRKDDDRPREDAFAAETPTATTPLSPKPKQQQQQQQQHHLAIHVIHHNNNNKSKDEQPDNTLEHSLETHNTEKDSSDGIIKQHHQVNNAAISSSSSSSSPSTTKRSSSTKTTVTLFHDRPFWQRFLLTINVILCVPMYSMLLCLGVYMMMLQWYWNVIWFRTLWLLYLPYCVLDPTPTWSRKCLPESWRRTLRNFPGFAWVAYYFPVTLIKTCDLDPSQHYLFLYHPHGVIGMGANTALNTNGAKFDQIFPGIRRSSVTLNACFWAPLFREWILGIGFISANKTTILRTLQHESVVLVPGGAAEALHAHEGVCKFYLQQRKGFCRLALEASCPLIPCIAFGENEAFSTYYMAPTHHPNDDHGVAVVDSNNQDSNNNNNKSSSSTSPSWQPTSSYSCSLPPPPSSSFVRRIIWHIQQRLLRSLSFSTPILVHPIPRPHPIHVVVGSPVPPLGTVDELHEQYIRAIRTLYDQHQDEFGYQHVPLEII